MFNKDEVFSQSLLVRALLFVVSLAVTGYTLYTMDYTPLSLISPVNQSVFIMVLIIIWVGAVAFFFVQGSAKKRLQFKKWLNQVNNPKRKIPGCGDEEYVFSEFRNPKDIYRSIIDSLSSAVLVIDMQEKILLINSGASELLGLEKERFIGKNYRDMTCLKLLPDKKCFLFSLVEDTLKRGIRYQNIELEGLLKDNQTMNISVSTKILYDHFHHPMGIMLAFTDETTVKQLEEQLQRYECLSVVGQMAAGIVHEIRNPLQSIMSFIQLLEERKIGNDHILAYTDIVMHEINRINCIIREFLQLSRPANAAFHRHDLNSIIKEIVLLMESESILNNIAIETEYGKKIPSMILDRAQLKQAIINMLSNAFAAMPQGGTVTIKTWYDYHLNEACIEISDTGVGMDTETINQIGTLFFTTKDQGTGLGLPVSYRIINDHGGQIEVSSSLGKGSTFLIKLPGLGGLGEELEGFHELT
ncbi:MAG: two-component system sensor histidine kinase NtrB [Bacillota bacterium]|jgi:PAS domain S-box-containing protein